MQSRFSLSAIVAALGLALACQAASAQDGNSVVTVTQQGNGNTSYAEQSTNDYPFNNLTATITQIGDNNHVGGPGSTTSGVLQIDSGGSVDAQIRQTGVGNNAGITQVNVVGATFPVTGEITQFGSHNTATLRQTLTSDLSAVLIQNGNGNPSAVEQAESIPGTARTTQTGDNNSATIFQRVTGYVSPRITQDGEGNVASAVVDVNVFGGPLIEQTGTANYASTLQTDTEAANIRIGQTGATTMPTQARAVTGSMSSISTRTASATWRRSARPVPARSPSAAATRPSSSSSATATRRSCARLARTTWRT
jgi:hypothetical protein